MVNGYCVESTQMLGRSGGRLDHFEVMQNYMYSRTWWVPARYEADTYFHGTYKVYWVGGSSSEH